jgi:hypothetical protein
MVNCSWWAYRIIYNKIFVSWCIAIIGNWLILLSVFWWEILVCFCKIVLLNWLILLIIVFIFVWKGLQSTQIIFVHLRQFIICDFTSTKLIIFIIIFLIRSWRYFIWWNNERSRILHIFIIFRIINHFFQRWSYNSFEFLRILLIFFHTKIWLKVTIAVLWECFQNWRRWWCG